MVCAARGVVSRQHREEEGLGGEGVRTSNKKERGWKREREGRRRRIGTDVAGQQSSMQNAASTLSRRQRLRG